MWQSICFGLFWYDVCLLEQEQPVYHLNNLDFGYTYLLIY